MAELKRKIDKYLVDWKNAKDRKPLIIKGARQIWKTISIEKFGRENYKSFIEKNLVAIPLTLGDGSRLKKLFNKICKKALTN